jgi:hypothetical protein
MLAGAEMMMGTLPEGGSAIAEQPVPEKRTKIIDKNISHYFPHIQK